MTDEGSPAAVPPHPTLLRRATFSRKGRRERASASCDTSGAAILEFALVLPLLVLVFAGTVELGRALTAYLAMEKGVRAGARFLARAPEPSCEPVCSPGAARAMALARDEIVAGTGLAPAAIRLMPDPTPPAGTVVLTAAIELPVAFLGDVGLPRTWRISVSHQEQRLAE